MDQTYFLSPHVHVCVAGKHVLLLDLKRDKYLAVVPPHGLARWVRDWPVKEPAEAAQSADYNEPPKGEPEEDDLLSQMIVQGVLTADAKRGKAAVPVTTQRPQTTLLQFKFNQRPLLTATHFWRLAAAHARARSALRFRAIQSIVQAVSLRKARRCSTSLNIETARELVAAFVYLRPLFYKSIQGCLLDCLTLVHFLAQYRIFPSWVFGIQADPFYAHCWIQHEGTIFNDVPDYVGTFTPILIT